MVLALRSFRFQEEEENNNNNKNRIIALIEAQAIREPRERISPDCGKTRWGAEI